MERESDAGDDPNEICIGVGDQGEVVFCSIALRKPEAKDSYDCVATAPTPLAAINTPDGPQTTATAESWREGQKRRAAQNKAEKTKGERARETQMETKQSI